jgi:ferredoxin-nitrite reductase
VSVNRSICPDIYHPAIARDGLLTRLRLPGGVVNVAQCQAIGNLLAATGLNYIQVTNRANLQLRGLEQDLEPELLAELIACGLVAENKTVDGIRNIMASPTAGIDATELIDVRPVVDAWDKYLISHPELGVLSNKFSVGFDGGGSVSILDRPNDITLLAVADDEFLLHLTMGARGDAPVSVGVRLTVAECVPMLGAIAQGYLRGCKELGSGGRKLRLREVIEGWGLEWFWRVVMEERDLLRLGVHLIGRGRSGTQMRTEGDICKHLGVFRQQQVGLNYVGMAVPLGRVELWQMCGLEAIARRYGSGTMRLTPWQNAIMPDVRDEDVGVVQGLIEDLGFGWANHVNGLLTACAGASGCQFASGDTQADAIALSENLQSQFTLDRPLNIHFSGCDKSCAQHYQADIALWGCPQTAERPDGYRLCLHGGTDKFGREVRDYLTPEDVKLAIDRLIRAYQERRASPQESFRAFTDRQSLAQLQQILNVI